MAMVHQTLAPQTLHHRSLLLLGIRTTGARSPEPAIFELFGMIFLMPLDVHLRSREQF